VSCIADLWMHVLDARIGYKGMQDSVRTQNSSPHPTATNLIKVYTCCRMIAVPRMLYLD